jgi:hypothetical protein
LQALAHYRPGTLALLTVLLFGLAISVAAGELMRDSWFRAVALPFILSRYFFRCLSITVSATALLALSYYAWTDDSWIGATALCALLALGVIGVSIVLLRRLFQLSRVGLYVAAVLCLASLIGLSYLKYRIPNSFEGALALAACLPALAISGALLKWPWYIRLILQLAWIGSFGFLYWLV